MKGIDLALGSVSSSKGVWHNDVLDSGLEGNGSTNRLVHQFDDQRLYAVMLGMMSVSGFHTFKLIGMLCLMPLKVGGKWRI